MDAVVRYGQGCLEFQRLVITVNGHAVAIRAFRQRADARQRRLARGFDDCLSEPVQVGDLELVHHVDQPPAPFVVAGGAGIDVALDLKRLAHIGSHHSQQVLVHLAFARERHDRNGDAFLENLSAIRAHTEPADIDDMDRVGKQRDRLAAIEGRRHHRDVMQMAGGEPGIVGDVVIAGLHAGERIFIEEVNDRIGHRIDVTGRAGHRLRQHATVTVEYAGGEVAGLAH